MRAPFHLSSASISLVLMLAVAGCPDSETGSETDSETGIEEGAPVITLIGDAYVTVEEGDDWTDPGAEVTDDEDSDLEYTVTGEVDTSTAGVYELVYNAEDSDGNQAEPVTRTVEVVYSGKLVVAGTGTVLQLVGLDSDGTMAIRDSFDLKSVMLESNRNHNIFDVALHPTSGDLYVTSFNEASGRIPGLGGWGNNRIDRFSYNVNELAHEGVAFRAYGPIRMLAPQTSNGTDFTMEIHNDSPAAVAITTVVFDTFGTATTSSDCDGQSLAPGAFCTATVVGFDEAGPNAEDAEIYVSSDFGEQDFSFEVNSGVGSVAEMDSTYVGGEGAAPIPSCGLDADEDVYQLGSCAMTALVFSPDGSELFANEDNMDIAIRFTVNADGTLTYRNGAAEAPVSLQGIELSDDGSVMYNGLGTYAVTADDVSSSMSGAEGNATEFVNAFGKDHLVTTVVNTDLAVYTVDADPLVPVEVDTLELSDKDALFQAHSTDLSRIALAGATSLRSVSFDGSALTEDDLVDLGDGPAFCPPSDCLFRHQARYVDLTADGSQAVLSQFVFFSARSGANDDDAATPDYWGRLAAYSVDPTSGELTESSELTFPGNARAVKIVPQPE